jgi:hypothetical protein
MAQVLPPALADLHVVRCTIRTKRNAFALCEKENRKKEFHEKEFPVTIVAGRIVVCDRRATRQAQIVARLASRLQLDHTTRHKSCHLLWLICMSFDAQSAPNETRSLCARKRTGQKNFSK